MKTQVTCSRLTRSMMLRSLCIIFLAQQAYTQELSYTFTVEKDTFLVGESAQFEFVISNNSSSSLAVNYPLMDYPENFRLEVVDQLGKTWPYNGHHITEGVQPVQTVYPGEFLEMNNSLSAWYGERGLRDHLIGVLPPGRYSVGLIYRPNDSGVTFRSPKVNFWVMRPGDSELKPYDLWMQYEGILPGTEHKRQTDLLTDLVDHYRESAYRPAALTRLIYNLVLSEDTSKARLYLQELLRRYPASIFAWEGVLRFAWNMNKEQRLTLYRSLAQQYQRTKVGDMLLNEIRLVQRWNSR